MKDYSIQNYQTAEHYGYDKQSNILIEECAELIQAISKRRRVCEGGSPDGDLEKVTDNLIEEIADVEIMLDQIKYLLCINPRYIENIKAQKIERQRLRIEGEKNSRFSGLYIDRSRV